MSFHRLMVYLTGSDPRAEREVQRLEMLAASARNARAHDQAAVKMHTTSSVLGALMRYLSMERDERELTQ